MTLPDAPPPYGTVVFDCDSTLSAMEGIEDLAAGSPHAAELARLTAAAMDGRVALEEVFGRRLELVRPSRAAVEGIGRRYAERLVANADALVAALRALDKRVHVVSGGLLPAVASLARHLGLEADAVHAVGLRWDASGAYADFDRGSPLARAGGKVEVLEELARRPGAGALAFVGDGATDLEAAHVAARFVAFGGVVRREAVFARARVTCERPDFAALVPLLLGPDERRRLLDDPRHAPLVEASDAQP